MKSNKTILLILLFIIFQNKSWSQNKIDSANQILADNVGQIVEHAILHKAFPGCVVFASKGGIPFHFSAYGHHTYDSIRQTRVDNIFDLASVTKVAAATLALMKLYEEGEFDLDDPIGKYIDGLGWSDVRKATFREILAHQAGYKSWIKYYDRVKRKNGKYRRKTLSDEQSEVYPFKVSEGLYLHADFYSKIKKYIRRSEVSDEKQYVYSGLFFYLVPELVQNLTGKSFDEYLLDEFYGPMDLQTLSFNPLETFDPSQIVPTEIDSFFRMTPIHGTVHDEGAILMKGVSGNAGLFGNAIDLSHLFQMLLNGGKYDSLQLLRPATIDLFTTCQYPANGNRRGLGFDKPLLEYDSLTSSVAKSASFQSYGHSGYTGTFVWADPKYDLLYIFLSNRVYPTRDQRAIYELNVRQQIQQLLYDYAEQID
ncbi:MAG: serine hydrolase [Cyclobacteriaceae bacterium]